MRAALLCCSVFLFVVVGNVAGKDSFCDDEDVKCEEGKACIDTYKCNKKGKCFHRAVCKNNPCHNKDCGSKTCLKRIKCNKKGKCEKFQAKCFKNPCAKHDCYYRTKKCVPEKDTCEDKKSFCNPIPKCVDKETFPSAFPCTEIKARASLDDTLDRTTIGLPVPRVPHNVLKLRGFEFYAARTGTLQISMHIIRGHSLASSPKYYRWRMVDVVVDKVGYHKVMLGSVYIDDDLPNAVFGFYQSGKGIIPYDVRESCTNSAYHTQVAQGYLPDQMTKWPECRDYSFRAITEVDNETAVCSITY